MKKTLLAIFLFMCISVFSFGQSASGSSPGEQLALGGSAASASNPAGLFATDLGVDDPVTFYPNPVKDNLSVRFPSKGTYTIRIYNIVGEKVAEKTVLDDDIIKINLSDVPEGMFFLSYEYGGHQITKTFSKSQ
jgi:hypothetical protein